MSCALSVWAEPLFGKLVCEGPWVYEPNTMTNVCFVEAIKLGHGNRDRLGYHGGHVPTMEIVSIFKEWTTRLRMD